MTQQEIHEVEQGIRPPEELKMTLEEFLEHDVEGYEYVNGELVPIAPPSREHGEISVNVIHYLYSHVYEQKLGRLYTAETTFQVGERTAKTGCRVCFDRPIDWRQNKGFFHTSRSGN